MELDAKQTEVKQYHLFASTFSISRKFQFEKRNRSAVFHVNIIFAFVLNPTDYLMLWTKQPATVVR